jgi:hypothetical protein
VHRSARNLLAVATVAALLATAGGCGRHDDTARESAPAATGTPDAVTVPAVSAAPSGGAVTAADLAGHWTSGVYGDAYIQVDGQTVKVVYEHDDGRILGALRGDQLVGWWTEAPTRQPSDDAGDVAFTVRPTTAGLTLHGGWRRGTTGSFTEDWDLTPVDRTIPAPVATLFSDPAGFVHHP